ncbi:hypothetical protein A1O3_08927 [Capronia epimyces CBS 606.96]|uniref:Uncharacterized protein n=1 Tax=Capronia epimyces CBS 606.96 TaxID=1182542 RepID=W9XQ39_9EURO|nr:uncharacterized protein A1O3_08927 [Capronia epimyces CBS 606.96]EXJ79425.1 hypothetical protein A1O3_08927 [Capronia epimyces CBS 606.96]
MSTPTPRGRRDASEDPEDLPVDHHLSLPAFHSVREASRGGISRTGSVASSSISNRSGSHHADAERAHFVDRLSAANSTRSDTSPRGKENEREDGVRQHHSTRSSGGFLLEPVTSSNRRSLVSLTPSERDSNPNKGSERSELMVPKRRKRDNGYVRSSFRSSPLSSELRPDPIIQNQANPGVFNSGTDIHGSPSSSRIDSRLDESVASGSVNMETERGTVAKIGYDQDPAQIVNMALTLSEGRRRLASGRRYASAEQGDRRVISATSTTSPRKTIKTRSMAAFLGSTRPSSRTGSPKPKFSTVFHEPGNASQISPAEAATSEPEHQHPSDADIDFFDQISPATAARVERAKAYFELAYEHRRLLPHLPPIRRPGSPAPSSGPEAFQKAYNPLQYVRNRKLRIWDKTPIDSEADGWHDLQRVRVWVDAVISSHPETQHDPVECVRLPPFDQRSTNSDVEESTQSPSQPKTTATTRIPDQFHARSIRPRSDWVTYPADLLADAYWLEQGMNKTKIQDRDNNPIYPPNTQFNFSGWRNTSPVDIPTILQQPSPPQSHHDLSQDEPPSSALPDLPTFTSALHAHKHSHHHRRRRDKLKDTLQIKDTNSSQERSRLRRKLFRDSSDSEDFESTSSGEGGSSERGRKRFARKRQLSPGNEGFLSHGSKFHIKKSPHPFGGSRRDSSPGSSAPNSKRSSVDHGALNKLFNVDNLKRASPLNRSRNRHESPQSGPTKTTTRSSLEHETGPRASTEYDTTTAPNSPNGVEWPSIAINLSPPQSRNTSPKRKTRSAILHPFHRNHHKDHDQVNTADFAHVPPSHITQRQGSDAEKQSDSPRSRATSPMNKGLGLESTNSTPALQQDRVTAHSTNGQGVNNHSKVSTRSTTTAASDYSRVRGIFKGGRIAEIVGHEVSRVGDFIWKRDPPSVYRHKGSASTASVRSYEEAEGEKEASQNGTIPKTPPMKLRSRSSTLSSTKSERNSPVSIKASSPPSGRPLYNKPNLPSFTSPFQKDREAQDKKLALLTADHDAKTSDGEDVVSRLTAQHHSTSPSPRRDRRTLPKLDTQTPTPPNGLNRTRTYGFGAAFDLTKPRDASDVLDTAVGQVNHTSVRPTKSAGDLAHAEGSETGQEEADPVEVSWRDISRAEALLYTSTVKAREIGRRADDDSALPKFLLDTLTPENQALHSANPLRVKKRERHIVAARNIMKNLDRHSATFNDRLHWFSRSMAPSLHTQLQMLEDMVEKNMTPMVRSTADKAGELSMKLTTSSTLAVKELNDSIDAAFRRRRRGPVRLARRVWFAGIEWTVVGLLWFIWAVVSLVQLILGVMRGFVKTVKWLLWIS